MDLDVPAGYRVKRKRKERKVLRPCQRTKNAMEDEGVGNTNSNWCARNVPQRLGKGPGRLWNKRSSEDHPNYRIVKMARILRRVRETWGDLLSHRHQWKTITERWCGKLARNNNNNMKRICKIVDFAVPADHRIKLKEIEKKVQYLDLARELKNYGTCRWQLYQLWLVLLVQ